jgi:hypothetical protein
MNPENPTLTGQVTHQGPPDSGMPLRWPTVWNQKPRWKPSTPSLSSSTMGPGHSPKCSLQS